MRHFIIILFVVCLFSCEWEKYPPEKYLISKKYRDLITSFKAGDTLKFQDNNGNLSLYLIEKIDSTLHNKRGYFINAKEYKDITIACHELNNTRPGYEDYYSIILTKNPEMDSTGFNLRLRDFYSLDTTLPIVLHTDTVTANNLSFTNYYSFRPYDLAVQKNKNSVTEIFMTTKDGIIAYRYLNNVWWTKVK